MKRLVYFFSELTTEHQQFAGGKGGTLGQLYQRGYPMPNGFVIMPTAFGKDELTPEAWVQVQEYLEQMRKNGSRISFAVRSSALCEDSSMASFAGQFDTVLEVRTDNEVLKAVRTVRQSRHSKEVRAYSEVKGIVKSDDMAVVVQQMVPADISGVLFTADPVTGSRNEMTGNYVFGLGEKLVSGQAKAHTFILKQSTGIWRRCSYDGPPELKKFANKLYRMGSQLEKELGCPQDIEWSITGRKLYLLQSRPITTLVGYNPVTGEWNDSMTGDYLWSNVNFGEAIPQVMTPLSWSVQLFISGAYKILPGYPPSGNIGGRPYINISIPASVLHALGKNRKDILQFLEGTLYTRIPDEMEIPIISLPLWSKIPILLNLVKIQRRQRSTIRELPRYLAANPDWCTRIQEQIQKTNNRAELNSLWQNEIGPHLSSSIWKIIGTVAYSTDYTMKLRRELTGLVGPDDADTLISSLSSSSDIKDGAGLLASLGPILGIAKVARREIDREKYLAQYGHRGPNEFELSVHRPVEDSGWFDEQLEQFRKSPVDVEALLSKQRAQFTAAWNRFQANHPRKSQKMRRRIDEVAPRARSREAVRSEYVRDRWVARTFALRAGQLTGLNDDIFFLTIEEVLDVLAGNKTAVNFIPARKETYIRYSNLPAYPSIIRGRFDPFRWAAGPNRCNDIYDAFESTSSFTNDSGYTKPNVIKGSAGSAGRIEGVVRRLDYPQEGEQLQKGEILVTSQTDIAWTPLFPRAAAIVTDVGAPLSHAAAEFVRLLMEAAAVSP